MQIPKFSNYRFDNKEEVSTNVELLSRNFNNNFDMLSGTLSSLKSTVSKTNKYMQDLPVITGEEQDPNGNYTGKAGTIYRNIRGGVGVTLWVKETEEDVKTGWAPIYGGVPSQMVTGSSTLQTLSRMATLNVNSATATITIPEGYSIGQRLLIRKIHATQGAVKIVRSGSEVFTRASLTSVELNANGDYWLLEKVTDTRWELLEGRETGSNADGEYSCIADGTQECWFYGNKSISASYAYGSLYQSYHTWNFAKGFVATPAGVHGQGQWSSGASWTTLAETTSTQIVIRVIDIVSRSAGTYKVSFYAKGRWYA